MTGRARQRGFLNITGRDLVGIAAAIGLIGWVLIEGLLWISSHISIGWVS